MIFFVTHTEGSEPVPYDVPFTLDAITMEQFLGWYETSGRELDLELVELLKEPDDFTFDAHIDKEALVWFGYWAKLDVSALPGDVVTPILQYYRMLRYALHNTETESTAALYHWNGQQWQIQDYKVTAASKMVFNEVVTSKELMRQITALGQGRWDGLPYLCSVFLRPVDEPFLHTLVDERVALFQALPMSIAVQVAFFLTDCVSIWKKTLLSSNGAK